MISRACLLFVFLLLVSLVGCSGAIQTQSVPVKDGPCTVDTYREKAQPLMIEFGKIVKEIEIRDSDSRDNGQLKLESLQEKINMIRCRNDFPLKHETLEYSVKHMLDAIKYADEENYVEMNNSINKSLVNVEAFNDWTQDIGK